MNNLYVIGLLAFKSTKSTETFNPKIGLVKYVETDFVEYLHTAGYVEANSVEEAEGKAMRICREIFLASEGYINHSIAVNKILPEDMLNFVNCNNL